MKRALALGAAVAAVGVGNARPCAPLLRLPPATSAGETALYGHIVSLTPKGKRFVLKFDPALWLTGITASHASLEDTGSREVSNDYYVVEEGHRLLTYWVPPATAATVLKKGICTTPTTIGALAKSVPKAGFWIRVRIDTVRSLDQQYRP